MLKELVIAIQSYIQAHQFIQKYKLWKWIIIPGIVYAILFMISMYYFGKTSSQFIEWLSFKTGLKNWIDRMQSGLLGFLFALAGFAFWIVQMLLYFSLFKYVWLIIGSPVFAYLSEKTEAIIEGKEYPFSFKQLASDIVRGIKLSLRNALWQTVYSLTIVLLSIIPVVGWVTPVLALTNECYYYGFSMIDYSCERRKLNPTESIFFVNHHKGLAIGNGLIFYLMHLLPVIGWVLAPAYAVIAATLSMRQINDWQEMKEA
ncbi:MAG: EI24 domain-containing protein [Filimonas sp.]|nr:EI24 domain-containing protein [Filimonas sp.]